MIPDRKNPQWHKGLGKIADTNHVYVITFVNRKLFWAWLNA